MPDVRRRLPPWLERGTEGAVRLTEDNRPTIEGTPEDMGAGKLPQSSSVEDVIRMKSRFAFGYRYGCNGLIIQPNPSITSRIPMILGM